MSCVFESDSGGDSEWNNRFLIHCCEHDWMTLTFGIHFKIIHGFWIPNAIGNWPENDIRLHRRIFNANYSITNSFRNIYEQYTNNFRTHTHTMKTFYSITKQIKQIKQINVRRPSDRTRKPGTRKSNGMYLTNKSTAYNISYHSVET